MSIKIDFKIYKKYDSGFILDINGIIDDGITAVFGPSASGKTTFLNCIAGFLNPDQGEIKIGDQILYSDDPKVSLPIHKRKIGYVSQELTLFPHMNVRDNIYFGYNLLPGHERKISPEYVINFLDIKNLLNKNISSLSGGEKQKVALARVLSISPVFLLLDEALVSIDKKASGKIIENLKRIWSEFKIPIIYVSHSISEVLAIANRVLILEKGEFQNFVDANELLLGTDMISSEYWFGFENIKRAEVVSKIDSNKIIKIKIEGVVFKISEEEIFLNEQINVSISSNEIILSKIKTFDTSVQNIIQGKIISIKEFQNFALVCVEAGGRYLSRISLASARKLDLKVGGEIFMMIKSNSIKILS